MSSDDSSTARVSTEILERLIRPASVDELGAWEESPYDFDVGAATVRDSVFGKLGLPVVWNGEVLLGSHIVDAERVDPKDAGRVMVIDLTELGWSRDRAMAAAVGEMTALQQVLVDQVQLADLVAGLHDRDQALAEAAGWGGDEIDALIAAIEFDGDPTLDAGTDGGDLVEGGASDPTVGPLVDRFVVPPFSVLDTRQGYWQARKREWLALGMRSELGRGQDYQHQSPNDVWLDTATGQRASDVTRQAGKGRPAITTVRYAERGEGCAGRAERGETTRQVPTGKRAALDGVPDRGEGWTERARKGETTRQGPATPAEDQAPRPGETPGAAMSGLPHMRAKGWLGGTPSRREQDAASNLTGQRDLPDWANNGVEHVAPGTSIFDPVLCEIAYRWFTPGPGSTVLDPFAGGVVRGAIAARLGHRYTGVELRPEQVAANEAQDYLWAGEGHLAPTWVTGDARDVGTLAADGGPYDMAFACPPYADLERYSDDPQDLSTLDPDEFLGVHAQVIADTVALLAEDRFAVWVISEVRHSQRAGGPYLGFVPATIQAFADAGAALYNELVLVNAIGSLALRAPRIFSASRKVGRTHQNVLVFVKGNPAAVNAAYPPMGDSALPGVEPLHVEGVAHGAPPSGDGDGAVPPGGDA